VRSISAQVLSFVAVCDMHGRVSFSRVYFNRVAIVNLARLTFQLKTKCAAKFAAARVFSFFAGESYEF
jgi:hypothetical protein